MTAGIWKVWFGLYYGVLLNPVQKLEILENTPHYTSFFLFFYLHDLPVCLVHLVHDRRRVFDELSDGVDVVVRDEQQVFRPRTEKYLVFEGHDHQLVKLRQNRQEVIRTAVFLIKPRENTVHKFRRFDRAHFINSVF